MAATLLSVSSHRRRVRSEAAFAALAGVAPLPASSGKTGRYRLSRGGDRQLNMALDVVARVRMSHDPATRAYVVRRATEGRTHREIAQRVGASPTTVIEWRSRCDDRGLAGLDDRERSGRPRELDHRVIVAETLKPPPKKLGMTHWSSRLLAERLRVSATSIRCAWRAYGVKPWKAESFRVSTDPELVGKVTDICGLYLGTNEDVPANAIVLSVDEKSQIHALDRTVPILPMQEGGIERRSHDYYRHGTTTLFAALEIATGQVVAALKPKHRHQEFLAFLRHIERTYRRAVDERTGEPVELHLVMDNYAAHKHKNVREWLAANPRFKVHFTPTHASWMNLVEVWFGLLERQDVCRGVFKSVPDLNAKLRAHIEGWNERAHPFVRTKTAEDILKKAKRHNNFKSAPLATSWKGRRSLRTGHSGLRPARANT